MGLATQRLAIHPCSQDLPLRIALRFPVSATRMEAVPARRLRQRMLQQGALYRVARHHEQLPDFKVLARLGIVPGGGSWSQRLERRTAMRVARHAARMPRPFLEKNGLHLLFEESEVQGRSG